MTTVIRPRRSVLYMPGINERALEKAKTIPADSLILDLEDSVAPDSKDAARHLVCARVKSGGYGSREIIIRINGLESEWGEADLEAAAQTGADGILVPKVNSANDILDAAERKKQAGGADNQQMWAMIETPLGVLNAQEIAAAAIDANLTCLILGTNDLLKETRAQFLPDRAPVLAWLSAAVIAARAYGLDVIDGVYNNFRDEDGLIAEAEQGRALGMDGKTLIHPAQLDIANKVFAPTESQIDLACRQMEAFDEARARGEGVAVVDGKIVENLHIETARQTLARADAIAKRA